MNKSELIHRATVLANGLREPNQYIAQKTTADVLNAILTAIAEAVANGEKVTLVGFGSFESRSRKEREGRNPATGEQMTIPAATVPTFSAGKVFKDEVRQAVKVEKVGWVGRSAGIVNGAAGADEVKITAGMIKTKDGAYII